MTAEHAYLGTVAGLLLVYVELIRPGLIIAGCLGSVLFLYAAHQFWAAGVDGLSCALLVLSLGLLLLSVWWGIAGRLFAVVHSVGSLLIVLRGPHLPGVAVLPVAAGFISISLFLSRTARLARRMKQLDGTGDEQLSS